MIQNDEFEQKLIEYFQKDQDQDIPEKIKEGIRNIDLTKAKRSKPKINLKRIIAVIVSILTMSTGIVFAKDISKFTQKLFFDSKQGVETAIENGYIYTEEEENNQEKETKIIESENTNTRISRMIMDDYTLDIEMMIKIEDSIDLAGVEHIDFPDMIITDDMNNILYCVNNEKIKSFCDEKGLPNDYESIKEFYINTSSNVFMKNVSEKFATIECNLTASGNKFPISKTIYIQLNTIEIEKDTQKYVIEGDWNIKFTVPEEFVDRKTAIYRVKSCNNEYVEINSIYAEVYETGMRFDMSMYWGDYEEWSKKADEIRKQNVLASQLINFEKSYVENENGEKFYSSKSSYAGNGLTTDGKLRMWNTFDLTKYNMTDKLKVALITIDNEQIIIELER